MNETFEKRFAVQQHFEAVLHSLKEAELSTREQAEINNEHIVHLMSTLETVDKLKNGNEDVSDARETIDTIFHQAEKQLQEAAQLLVECCDQTETSALCIDWDVSIYENIIIFCLVFNNFPISFLDLELPLVLAMEL